MRRLAITGSSGYYGRKLIEHVRRVAPAVSILGIDVVPPRDLPPDEFVQLDVRQPKVRSVLARFQPDTIVHLAFVVNPIRDNSKMHDINVGGTRNVFEAVRTLRPNRFLMSSSATTYGAWPDNPVPLSESAPLRAHSEFQYASDKATLEADIQKLSDELPEVAVAWTRPTIIVGDGVDNYLSRFFCRSIFVMLPDGVDLPMQLVHEDDVAAATWAILAHDARGPFNVGPPDWIKLSEFATLTGRRPATRPVWLMKAYLNLSWPLQLPIYCYPPSMVPYVRHPWVIAPTRLEQELGFRFQYSCRDAATSMWNAHLARKRRRR